MIKRFDYPSDICWCYNKEWYFCRWTVLSIGRETRNSLYWILENSLMIGER